MALYQYTGSYMQAPLSTHRQLNKASTHLTPILELQAGERYVAVELHREGPEGCHPGNRDVVECIGVPTRCGYNVVSIVGPVGVIGRDDLEGENMLRFQ